MSDFGLSSWAVYVPQKRNFHSPAWEVPAGWAPVLWEVTGGSRVGVSVLSVFPGLVCLVC